jgi:hypothetical protein
MTAAALMVASRAMKLSAYSSIVQGGGGRGAHSVSSGLRAQRTNRGYLLYRYVHHWGIGPETLVRWQ